MKIAQPASPALLHQFSEFLSSQMGLYFPSERWSDMVRGLAAAAREFSFEEPIECLHWLMSKPLSRRQIEIIASHLTIGETYFFRDSPVFDALQNHLLPALIQLRRKSGKRLRIWSAGCSSGEEAYSLAILLQKLIPDYCQWNISILGTDINPHVLRKAALGIYGDWSFRGKQLWLRDSYFQPISGGYQIAPHVQNLVKFSYHNLALDAYPSLENGTNAMDIIFCRNVLMYFEPERAKKIVQQLCHCLLEGGWLIVSAAETSPASLFQMEAVLFRGALIFRKKSADQASTGSAMPVNLTELKEAEAITRLSSPHSIQRQSASNSASTKSYPIQKTAIYQQALTFYRQGRYPEAAELVNQLVARQNNNTEAMNLMVRIHANQGELATALQWCKYSIAADRINPGGYYLMAIVLLEQGHLEEAMMALKRTLYLDPSFVLAHFTLANLFFNQSKLREARLYFDNALTLLKRNSPEDVLPESEGVTAGRLIEIVRMITDGKLT